MSTAEPIPGWQSFVRKEAHFTMLVKSWAILVALAILAAGCAGPATTPLPVSTPGAVKVTQVGHRGAAGLAAENTMAAFRAGIASGAQAIELDVHLTKDGALVVMHDANVSTTTDGNGAIGALTLAEIKKLNAAARSITTKDAQEVPTLDQPLALAAASKVDVYIEIKVPTTTGRYPGIEAKVVEAVKQAGMAGRVMVISFDLPTLQAVKSADASLPTGWLMQRAGVPAEARASAQALADLAKRSGVDNLGISRDYLSAEIVQAAHAKGLTVGVWTVDDPTEMKQFAAWGVDAITTNRPDVLVLTLGK
jgi:glycerophosphoryl diester phosphodiesterase